MDEPVRQSGHAQHGGGRVRSGLRYAKVSPTLAQRCGNGAAVELSRRHPDCGEVQMKTATQKAASRPGLGLGEGVLADRQWLDAHLLDPRVRVVEVDVSPVAYDDWHIDGAVLWNVYTDLKDAGYRTVGAAALQRLVARSGIGPDSTVVFYGYAPAL